MTSATVAGDRAGLGRFLGYFLAFGAAIAYGGSQVITRESVPDLAPPLVGSAIALGWGTLCFLVLSVRRLRAYSPDPRKGLARFALAGIFSAVGFSCLVLALERGPVVLVAPVTSTNPLITLLLAALFLRGVERITARVVLGALLVVAGVVVLTVL